MRLWSYYAWHSFINMVKRMFKSTLLATIAVIVIFFAFIGIVGFVVGNVADRTFSGGEEEVSTEASVEQEDDYEYDYELTADDIAEIKICMEAAAFLIILGALLLGIYNGSKNGTDIFSMADVNLLFTAPVKPQSVLLFRLSFQVAATICGSVYILFQIPNLVRGMGLDAVAVLAIFIAWILACVLNRFAMILSYTVFTTYDKFKRHVGKINFSAAGLIVIIFLAAYYSNGRNIIEALKLTYGNPLLRWIPIIGWYKGMIMSAVNGQLPPFAGYLFLLLVGMGVFIFLIWQIKADFYEDALSSANKNEGQDGAASASVIKKERSEKISRSGSFGGEGAMVFFTKEMYIRRRLAKFGVVTKTMIFYFFVCAIGSLITLNVFEDSSFFVTGMILLIILFFRNQGNPIAQETGMNWLFLVPDNPYKKVFYAMLAGTVSTAIDILPGLFVSEIILGENILKMILWYITVMAADFMFSASGMLLEAVSSGSALDAVKLIINMALRMAVVVFIVSFMSVGFLIGGEITALVYTLILMLAAGGGIFCVYPSFLHRGV